MAVMLHSSFSISRKAHHLFDGTSSSHALHICKSSQLQIRNQDNSSEEPSSSTSTKQSTTGLGFGGANETPTLQKKQKSKKEKGSVVRRVPLQKAAFGSENEAPAEAKEQAQSEAAFLLAWSGLGGIILLQGLTLAASGFLPEEWDSVFVNYLYPAFTPTVFLFVAGTVAYGVSKYLQNEKFNSKN